jgi:hypothetical protein
MYYRIYTWSFSIGISVWLVSAGSVNAQEASSLKRRLLQEAPQAWKNYQEFFQALQGNASGERRELTGNEKNQITRRVVSHWKRCKGYSLLQQEAFSRGSYSGTVRGYNPQYKFMLARGSEQKPWVVQELTQRSPDDSEPPRDPPLGLFFGNPPGSLPYLFDSPDFKVVNVAPEGVQSEELVRMTFTYSPKDKAKERLRGGWIVLDHNHDWVIRRGEIELVFDAKTKVKQTFVEEYKEGSGHHPIPTKNSLKATVLEDGRITYEYEGVGTSNLYEQQFVPESEFTLSAFGLPEPAWLKPKNKRSWYLWAGLAGVLCLVSAGIVRWAKRRPSGVGHPLGG